MELYFDQNELIKIANLYNIPVQTNLNMKNSEGYEGYDKQTGTNHDFSFKNSSSITDFTAPCDAQIDTEISNPAINNDVDQAKKLEIHSGSLQDPSQHTQHSSNPSISDKLKEIIYRLGNTDTWRCKKCNLSGDKWYMQVHPCRGI